MADDTVSAEFAEGALAALASEGITAESPNESKDAPVQATGTESAGVEPEVATLAAELKKLGLTPDQARAAYQDLTSLQTPQGQAEYWSRFIESPAGKQLREQYGRDYLAGIMAQPGGGSQLINMARSLGHNVQAEPDEELTPEQQEIRNLKAQQQALVAKLQQIEGSATETRQALAARASAESQQTAFLEWARSNPGLNEKAYSAVARRAYELAQLRPQAYGSRDGFKRAAKDAFAELQSAASAFAAPKRPTSLRSQGGGAVPGGFDPSKHSLKELISFAADDIASNMRGTED